MTVLNHKEVEARIKEATGHVVRSEDGAYILKPLDWYYKEPLFGFKRYRYEADKADCDDRCTILKFAWLLRWRKEKGSEALPVFQVKALMKNGTTHWFMLVVHDKGVSFMERLETSIAQVQADSVEKIWTIHV